MPETFTVPVQFPVEWPWRHETISTVFDSGDVQTRAKWTRPRRKFSLRWEAATEQERADVEQFFNRMRGRASSFTWTPPIPVGPPGLGVGLSSVTSGALAQRTYYVVTTWTTANGETIGGTRQSIVVPINKVLRVTSPSFPVNVTGLKVYANTVSGDEEFQATISTSGGTWTEPDTGLIAGVNPPTANGATETLTVHFAQDEFAPTWIAPKVYRMQVDVEEMFT